MDVDSPPSIEMHNLFYEHQICKSVLENLCENGFFARMDSLSLLELLS